MVPGNPVANMYFAMYGQNPQVSRKSFAGQQGIVNIASHRFKLSLCLKT